MFNKKMFGFVFTQQHNRAKHTWVLCTIVLHFATQNADTMSFDFNKNGLGIKHFASKMIDPHKI